MGKKGLILLPGFELYGQEKALISIAKILKNDYQIYFLTHKDWGEKIRLNLKDSQLNYYDIPFGTIWSLSLGVLSIFSNFFKTIYSSIVFYKISIYLKPNFIILGNATFSFYLLPILLFNRKVKIIYRHGDEAADHSFFHRAVNKIIFKITDIHVVNCSFLKNSLCKNYKILESKIIYNCPVNLLLNQKNSEAKIDIVQKNYINILYVGQISKLKGVHILLKSFSLLNISGEYKLTLVGGFPGLGVVQDSVFKAEFMNAVESSSGSLIYIDFKDNLVDFYTNADILVIPSINNDPSPNVILEGKSFGLPCVSFSVGGIPELIENGVDGFLCNKINESSLAYGLKNAADLYKKNHDLKNFIKNKFNNKFGIDRFYKQWKEVIE